MELVLYFIGLMDDSLVQHSFLTQFRLLNLLAADFDEQNSSFFKGVEAVLVRVLDWLILVVPELEFYLVPQQYLALVEHYQNFDLNPFDLQQQYRSSYVA